MKKAPPAPPPAAAAPSGIVHIDDLAPDPSNARTRDAKAKRAISGSLQAFGAARSIVLDRNNRIVAGNGTVEEARALGLRDVLIVDARPDQIVAVRRSDWTNTEATAYGIADNRSNDLSRFDEPILARKMLSLAADGVKLESVGYDDADYRALMDRAGASKGRDDDEDSDEGPEGVEGDPDPSKAEAAGLRWGIEPGQVWEVPSASCPGRAHRLIVGDCRAEASWDAIGARDLAGVVTSPPYAEQRKDQYGGIKADEYVDWFKVLADIVRDRIAPTGSFLVNIKPHSEDKQRSLYVDDLKAAMASRWGWLFIEEYIFIHQGTPGEPRGRLKNQWEPVYQFALGTDYLFTPENVQHESGRSFRAAKGGDTSLIQGTGGCVSSKAVLSTGLAYPGNVLRIAREGHGEGGSGHPATFSVKVPDFYMRLFSGRGDEWCDPFMGSGSSLVAAEGNGRICHGIERHPPYVGLILDRAAKAGLSPRLSDP